MDAVRPRIPALAPGAQKIALTVEHHDRVLAAVEDVYIVFGINPHGPDLLERPSVRQLRPILDDAVFEIPAANDNCHARPRFLSRRKYRSHRRETSSPRAGCGGAAAPARHCLSRARRSERSGLGELVRLYLTELVLRSPAHPRSVQRNG